MKPTSLIATLAALAWTIAPLAAADAPRTIVFGSDFAPDRPPAALDLLFESGLNCVRLTGGGYGWAAGNHAKLAGKLAAKGVQVYLQLGSHYPSADYFPEKDAWLVDQDGKTGIEDRNSWAVRYDHSCWPQYSYAHLGIRAMFEKDFTAYLTHFPAGPNLAGVILHNEPGMHWLANRIFDYSAVNVAAFRAWLPSQHADIAALNQRWGSSFASFAEVAPPAKATPGTVAPWMDWRRFQVFQIAEFMRWEADFAKRVRPDLARTTNLDGPTNNWYAIRCADIEAYSRAMDTVGMDIYPTPWTDRAFVPYAVDQLQGVAQGRRAHVLECEVFGDKAHDWKKLDAEQRADLLRSELWTMYGHGADGILLWGFSRSDDFSVTDGAWNPRVLVCRDLSYQQRMLGLGGFHRARPAVAICLDPDAYIRAGALGSSPLAGGSALDQEFHGIHAALAAAGIPCDVIMAAQLPEVASRYRALILPAAPLMDQATAERLRGFVEAGGTVVAVAPFAEVDRWGAPLATKPDFISASGAEQLPAQDGVPATTVGKVGTGRTALLGGPVGGAYLGGKAVGLPQALAGILARGGILPQLRITSAGDIRPDASLLAGNADRLLVVAAQGGQASATITATAVKIEIPGVPPKAAFAFPVTTIAGDRVRSGPVALPITATADGYALDLGTIRSALPILLARDAAPLLALEAAATVAPGTATTLRVTCSNPSDREVSGTVELRMPGATPTAMPVRIPAWGSASVDLPIIAPAATARLPLGAVLRIGTTEVSAIPVDIAVR